MIVVKEKKFDEVMDTIKDFNKILVVGCGGCVTFYNKGGRKETIELAEKIKKHNKNVIKAMIPRQCSLIKGVDYLDTLLKNCKGIDKELTVKDLKDVDAIVSLACGVGIQNMARHIDLYIVPANDTVFMGIKNNDERVFEEYCLGCGNCILHLTQYCPISLCPKSMLNGPCGGVNNGMCEVIKDRKCVWVMIYEKLKKLNRLKYIKDIYMPKDFSKKIKRYKI